MSAWDGSRECAPAVDSLLWRMWIMFFFLGTGLSQCLLCLLPGGNTSVENNPKHDGDDGTSFLGPEGEPFLYPLKGNVIGSWVYSRHLQSGNLYSAFDTFAVVCRHELLWLNFTVCWGKRFSLLTFWICLLLWCMWFAFESASFHST